MVCVKQQEDNLELRFSLCRGTQLWNRTKNYLVWPKEN